MLIADLYRVSSSFQSWFLLKVLTVKEVSSRTQQIKTKVFPPWDQRTWDPRAIIRQKPTLGMYKTRSATTNPTQKNRLEAGIKGRTMKARHNIPVDDLLYFGGSVFKQLHFWGILLLFINLQELMWVSEDESLHILQDLVLWNTLNFWKPVYVNDILNVIIINK